MVHRTTFWFHNEIFVETHPSSEGRSLGIDRPGRLLREVFTRLRLLAFMCETECRLTRLHTDIGFSLVQLYST